ncbi:MAG: laccase domain-containing protein [Patescibacteria group bacterium]|nr:laccase domain-containing protein [Patescibacteria group bacterium]
MQKENILISDECTVCHHEKFHSYRQDHPND